MSYAIGEVIYGITPDDDLYKEIEEFELSECPGFETSYSGNGETPIWIGPSPSGIDECEEVDLGYLMDELNSKIEEHKKGFEKSKKIALESLEESKEYADEWDNPQYLPVVDKVIDWVKNTEPRFKVVWGSS